MSREPLVYLTGEDDDLHQSFKDKLGELFPGARIHYVRLNTTEEGYEEHATNFARTQPIPFFYIVNKTSTASDGQPCVMAYLKNLPPRRFIPFRVTPSGINEVYLCQIVGTRATWDLEDYVANNPEGILRAD
ncbi:hypothetical protein BGZ76_000570 [Entomortierella beljakovae]|nr:hypothetical protein BGZ76_000570 [Entomortierella beljakovae]